MQWIAGRSDQMIIPIIFVILMYAFLLIVTLAFALPMILNLLFGDIIERRKKINEYRRKWKK